MRDLGLMLADAEIEIGQGEKPPPHESSLQ